VVVICRLHDKADLLRALGAEPLALDALGLFPKRQSAFGH